MVFHICNNTNIIHSVFLKQSCKMIMVTKWKKLISENIATVKEVLENVDIDKDIFFLEGGGSSFVMFFL